MVATLTRIFGVHNIALAEDVVQDAFCRALEVWKFRGVPENPAAWLMAAAKNRALDVLRRERTARTFAPELGRLLESEWTAASLIRESFGTEQMKDDELRMMFSCCHRRLPEEAQVALILNILCGFSVSEAAEAFLTSRLAMEKRIFRAKNVLAQSKKLFDIAGRDDFNNRLPAVQRALYLLFNEGYHGASPDSAVRQDLCREAIQLTNGLLEHPFAATPATYALAALMCLHGARLPARVAAGDLVSLVEQDRSKWDLPLVSQGRQYFERSAAGAGLTEYHVEAAIAFTHAMAPGAEDTDWGQIVSLYDHLMSIRPSPVVALNRAIAVAQHQGPERGLEEIRQMAGQERLRSYPFYEAAIGELELRGGRAEIAAAHFQAALALARNSMEARFLEQRVIECRHQFGPRIKT